MKKIIYTLIILAVIAIAVFTYATRPLKAPSDVSVPSNETVDTANTSEELKTFKIDQKDTKAEYTLGETLNGKPFQVVGTTSNVSGQISFDPKDADGKVTGEIKVDARTLKTDSSKRDGAVGRFVLKSETPENNYITFKPSEVSGIPADAKIGVKYDFKITGDLYVAGITKSVTFNVTGEALSENSIEGVATASIKRSDYKLVIPNIPFVADVDDNVSLKISFLLTR